MSEPFALKDAEQVEWSTRQWLEEVVIGLNLCPFARREYESQRIRFAICAEQNQEDLLLGFAQELERLEREPALETTLLIFPNALADFFDYLELLDMAQGWLDTQGLEGVYQLASFHPRYQFEGTAPNETSNFTNRSPWPMLHLLREASVEKAVAAHPDTNAIPSRNIALAKEKGLAYWQDLLLRLRKSTPPK